MKVYKILVIDDAFFVRTLLKKGIMLKPKKENTDYSFEIIAEAQNGSEGLQMCKELQPDIITVDFNMPELDGLEFIKYLKEIYPHIPVIMISSNNAEDFVKTVEATGCHFLSKPFQNPFLWQRLDKIVEEIENYQEPTEVVNTEAIDVMKEINAEVEAEFEDDFIELEDDIQLPKSQAALEKEAKEQEENESENTEQSPQKKKKKRKKKKKSNGGNGNNLFGLEIDDSIVVKPKTETKQQPIVQEIPKPISTIPIPKKNPVPQMNVIQQPENKTMPQVQSTINSNKQESISESSISQVKPIAQLKPVPQIKPIVQPIQTERSEQQTKPVSQSIPVPKINIKPIAQVFPNENKEKSIQNQTDTVPKQTINPVPKININPIIKQVNSSTDVKVEQPKPISTSIPKINLGMNKPNPVQPINLNINKPSVEDDEFIIEDNNDIVEDVDDFVSYSHEDVSNYSIEENDSDEEIMIIDEPLTADVDGETILIDESEAPIIIDDDEEIFVIKNNDEEIIIEDDEGDEDESIIIEMDDEGSNDIDDDFDLDDLEDFYISSDEIDLGEDETKPKRIGLNIKKEEPIIEEELTGKDLVIKTLKENANYSYQNEMSYVLHIMEKLSHQEQQNQNLVLNDEEPIQEQRPISRLMAKKEVIQADDFSKEREEEDAELDELLKIYHPEMDFSSTKENKKTLYNEESKSRLLKDAPAITQNVVIEPPKDERIRQMYHRGDEDENQLVISTDEGEQKESIFTKIFNKFSKK